MMSNTIADWTKADTPVQECEDQISLGNHVRCTDGIFTKKSIHLQWGTHSNNMKYNS